MSVVVVRFPAQAAASFETLLHTLLLLASCEVGEVELCRSLAICVSQLSGTVAFKSNPLAQIRPQTVPGAMVEIYTIASHESLAVHSFRITSIAFRGHQRAHQ